MIDRLSLTALPDLPMVQPGDDLPALISAGLRRAAIALQDGDVLVIAQKVVSKAEGRFVDLREVTPTPAAIELAEKTGKDPRHVTLILQEANEVVRWHSAGVIVVEHRLGFVSANAGIDHSNVSDDPNILLLLPKDPDGSAAGIRAALEAATGTRLAVIINDSHGRAWRNGTVGVAIGVSGLQPLQDMRGQPDLFDNALQVTTIGVADELAGAASLLMGQAREGRPIVHVRGFPYALAEGELRDLLRPKARDLFR